jgi:UDP-glucose:(glucosyl)LPS alpha-1,2-glucosyltransferase
MLIEKNELSAKAMGGTELMLSRIYDGSIPADLLEQFQIIPTRVRELDKTKYRILYVHDLPEDPEVQHLANEGWRKFHKIAFVSNWQAQLFIAKFNIPWSKVVVMLNAIHPITPDVKDPAKVNIIYHTTPHRGLNILLPVFARLAEKHKHIHLDVYSSFKLYGWAERDEQFKELFKFADDHPNITNHGSVDNDTIRVALSKANIFAYPSIWPETSCLALMEAMSAGLTCVHPNYAALFETGANWTQMYFWHEDLNEHAKIFFMLLDNAIENAYNENIFARNASQKVYADAFYNWNVRSKQWEALMRSIVASGESKDITDTGSQFVYRA